jgi:hypothetical protein
MHRREHMKKPHESPAAVADAVTHTPRTNSSGAPTSQSAPVGALKYHYMQDELKDLTWPACRRYVERRNGCTSFHCSHYQFVKVQSKCMPWAEFTAIETLCLSLLSACRFDDNRNLHSFCLTQSGND